MNVPYKASLEMEATLMPIKKLFTFCMALIFIFTASRIVFAVEIAEELPVTITRKDKTVSDSPSSIQVSGKLPVITIKDSEAVEKNITEEVNNAIQTIYDEKLALAEKTRIQSLLFSYEYKRYNNIISLVIGTTSTSSITKKEVDTINFHAGKGVFITISDILGPNGVELANKVISNKIKRNPEIYNPDFPGIADNHDFYVEESGKLVVLFDENEIAAASLGIQPFDIIIDSITNFSTSDYYTKTGAYGLKMLPLRTICEAFGYEVVWDDGKHSVDIINNGKTFASLIIGSNEYSKGSEVRALESPPEIRYGRTHVPISFFREILELIYSSDSKGIITFSQYE